jgi:hypothetical protein
MQRQAKPTMHKLSDNELAWIEFLRLLSHDRVPAPTLAAVQALRLTLKGREVRICSRDCAQG